MEVRLYDLAQDAIANAIEAGYSYIECPNCGGEGYWYHPEENTVCPLCDEKWTVPVDWDDDDGANSVTVIPASVQP